MNRDEELITRWIDGELDPAEMAELRELLEREPGLAERAKVEAAELGETLRRELPSSLEPPYPDFFNSQIGKRIREGAAPPAAASPAGEPFSVWSWLKSPFTLGAAAAACLAFVFARGGGGAGDSPLPPITAYAPDPMVTVAKAEFDEDAGATVILLTGLPRIPDSVEVTGRTIATHVPSGPRGFGRFYTEDRQLAYIMEADADGAPNIIPRGAGS